MVTGILQDDNSFDHGIKQIHATGQPILVGTISIEKSEHLAALLKKAGIPHEVLNAKQHEREAKIIAQAGRKGSITVSTNMAGRGTDILLGGNPEALTRDYFLKNKLAMPFAAAAAVIGGAESSAGANDGNTTTDGAATAVAPAPEAAQPMVLFQVEGKIFQAPADKWKPVYDDFAAQCKAEHDEVVALRRSLHISLRVPNVTKLAALIIRCAAARVARAIPVPLATFSHSKMSSTESSAASA